MIRCDMDWIRVRMTRWLLRCYIWLKIALVCRIGRNSDENERSCFRMYSRNSGFRRYSLQDPSSLWWGQVGCHILVWRYIWDCLSLRLLLENKYLGFRCILNNVEKKLGTHAHVWSGLNTWLRVHMLQFFVA